MLSLKNNTEALRIWNGQEIEAGAYYLVQLAELSIWRADPMVAASIMAGELVVNDGSSDIIDPLTGYEVFRGEAPLRLMPFADTGGFYARFAGFAGTALAGQTTNLDFPLSAERWLNGVQMILNNHVFGDSVTFQIVSANAAIAPVGYVLNTFGTNIFVAADTSAQHEFVTSYPARLLAGLAIRVAYTSVGSTDVQVRVNCRLHEKQ